VCAAGCQISVTPTVLDQFASWLKARTTDTNRNTRVLTVGDAVGGPVKPAVNGPATPGPVGPGVNGVLNPGLEKLDADGTPSCWMKAGYGSNTAALTVTGTRRSGARAAQVTVSSYVDGDAKWLPRFDSGGCSPGVAPGHTYSLRSWYSSTAVTQFAVYLRDTQGTWHYWTSSPWFPASPDYTQAVWTTPAIPTGMTGISFGLSAFGDGRLRTDDVAIYDTVGAPAVAAAATTMPTPTSAPRVSKAVEPPSVTHLED
jgi:hypothetical protein